MHPKEGIRLRKKRNGLYIMIQKRWYGILAGEVGGKRGREGGWCYKGKVMGSI